VKAAFENSVAHSASSYTTIIDNPCVLKGIGCNIYSDTDDDSVLRVVVNDGVNDLFTLVNMGSVSLGGECFVYIKIPKDGIRIGTSLRVGVRGDTGSAGNNSARNITVLYQD